MGAKPAIPVWQYTVKFTKPIDQLNVVYRQPMSIDDIKARYEEGLVKEVIDLCGEFHKARMAKEATAKKSTKRKSI